MADRPVPEVVGAYYRCLDEGSYDELREWLHPEFVHVRPDRTIDGADRFVRFMTEERPRTNTVHELWSVFCGDGTGEHDRRFAVEGTVRTTDGEKLLDFVDVMRITPSDRIRMLWTYIR